MFPKFEHSKMPSFRYSLAAEFIVLYIILEVLTNWVSTDLYNPLTKYIPITMRCVIYVIIGGASYIAFRDSKVKRSFPDCRLDSSGRHQASDVESLADSRGGPNSLLHQASDVESLAGIRGRPNSLRRFRTSPILDSSGRRVQSREGVSLEHVPGAPDFPGNDRDFREVEYTVSDWCYQRLQVRREFEDPQTRATIHTNEEWQVRRVVEQVRREVEDPQARVTIHTNDCVVNVDNFFHSDTRFRGSKVLLRRVEVGPRTTRSELEKLSSDFYAAMRRAREIDEDCTLQLGSFAVLKYTDAGLKSWRLEKQWTPTICCVVRYWDLLDLLPGQTTKWSIRGFNLQNAVLKVSTTEECEILKILHQYEESGEDVLICEKPRLLRHVPRTSEEAVYIYAVKSVEVEEGVTVDVQSKPKNVPRASWISVVECFRHSPLYTVIMVPCIQACIMVMIAVLFVNITHHHDLQQTGNDGLSLEESSILSLFLHELSFFFLVMIGVRLIFMATPTVRRLIEGRPLVDNVPGREITSTSEDLSGILNPSSPWHSENELGLTDVNIEEQEEEVDNVPGREITTTSEDLSGDLNPSSPVHSEGLKDVNIEEQEEEEGSDVLGGESTSTLSDSIDNLSFKTTLSAVADNKSIEKTENLEVDGSDVLGGESTSTLSDSIDNLSFKTTLPAVADNKSIEKTENLEVDVDDVLGQQKPSTSEDLSTNLNPTSPLCSENELGSTDVNTEEPEEEEGSGVLAVVTATMSSLLKAAVNFITSTKGPHKASPPDGIVQLNDSIWELYSPSKAQPPVCHDVDVIFFHGLQLGDFEDAFWKTWLAFGNKNVVWPKDWLSIKVPTARIFSASYNSSALRPEGQIDLRALGENLVCDIIDSDEDIGQNRPVFLVGHSLGGIAIKQFVRSAIKIRGSHDEKGGYKRDRITEFLKNLTGVFYYATPQDGSEVADMELTDRLGNLMGTSPILGLLKTLGTSRVRLNDSFEHHRKNLKQLRTFAVAEGMPTKYQGVKVMVVPQVSALQGADEKYVNAKATHFTVCQATQENDDAVIGKLVRFIRPSLPTSIL